MPDKKVDKKPTQKEETPDEQVFIEKEEKHPWDAKPLSLEGTARMLQLIGGMLGDAAQRAAVQDLMAAKGEKVQARWLAYLGAIGKEQLAEFLSIITGKSTKWVIKNYSLLNASRAIGQFVTGEDFEGVLKNVSPATPRLTEVMAEIVGSQEPSTD